MKKSEIEAKTEAMLAPICEKYGVKVYDVEYVKEAGEWYLRAYIDKEGGIEIDDCQALSEKLEERLDAEDFITDSYILEVSSPGIDRVLRKHRDFQREQGKKVDVSLYAPLEGSKEKELTGVLTGSDEASITLDEELQLPLEKVAQIRLHIDF